MHEGYELLQPIRLSKG